MGSSYPRDAIWRFKEENRALMKRMVGDLDSREVYREMRSSSFGVMPINDHMFNGLLDQYNFRIGSGLARVTNAKEEKIEAPHSAPTERPTETTVDIDYEAVGKETVTVMTSTSKATTKITTSESISTTTMAAPTTMQETITPTMVTTEQPSTTMQTLADTTIQQDDTTIKEVEAEEIDAIESRTESEYDMEEYEEYSDKEGGYYAEMLKDYTDNLLDSLKDLNPEQIEAVLPDAVKQVLKDDYESIEEEKEALDEMAEEEEELELIEEVEEIPEIEYTGEAINACPVKVEVKAPYWANNTRNQVLALLNLYPFEQYIHMEECTYEFEEMLCRPGCRCEQQWRLHRLLAFDPNNECRGIFSDWFRFPSFCVCKCYNVPEQIIEGLRKPRVLDASQYKPKVKKTLKKNTKEKAPKKSKSMNEAKELPQKKKNEARNIPTHHQNGPTHDIPHHNTHDGRDIEDQKLMNHRWTKDMKHPHIPAVFPYEGKMAYMAEISNRGGKGIKEGLDQYKETPEEKVLEKLPIPLPLVNEMDENHQDNLINVANINKGNMYIKDTEKSSKHNDDHFFYNQPIIEYKLSDGTTGTIPKTPRK